MNTSSVNSNPIGLTSTRDSFYPQTSYAHGILNAQPDDKGLWFRKPETLLSEEEMNDFVFKIKNAISSGDNANIRQNMKNVFFQLWKKMGTGLSDEDILEVVDSLDSFKSPYIIPIEEIDKEMGIYGMDQTTGPTDAFKDLALQMLTTMVSRTIEKLNRDSIEKALNGVRGQKLTFMVTQTSTSGDTGPAGGAGIEGKKFIINTIGFPAYEATYGQAGQMVILKDNVIAIPMNQAFTAIQESMKNGRTPEYEAQLKKILETEFADLIEKYGFEIEVTAGSFNSVNIGRIDGQSIYHTVGLLLAQAMDIPQTHGAEGINECIPSGNFGHAYGLIQAKQMTGKGVEAIIVSSNENDAIYRLLTYGKYKMADHEVSCPSASMIIRYGSNVERLLRLICGDKKTKDLMEKFSRGEEIVLSMEEMKKIKELGLVASKVDIEDELYNIRNVFLKTGKLICPHTSNAYYSTLKYIFVNPEDKAPIIISETASPWKFLAATATALSEIDKNLMKVRFEEFRKLEYSKEGVSQLLKVIEESFKKLGKDFNISMIPENLRNIYIKGFEMPEVVDASQFQDLTADFLRTYAPKFKKQVYSIISEVTKLPQGCLECKKTTGQCDLTCVHLGESAKAKMAIEGTSGVNEKGILIHGTY